jgi:hypothetical protein
MPRPAREVWHVVQGAEDGPGQGGAHLRPEALVRWHAQAPVPRVPPRKDLIVWTAGGKAEQSQNKRWPIFLQKVLIVVIKKPNSIKYNRQTKNTDLVKHKLPLY